jgi:serine/threonine-protein kinase
MMDNDILPSRYASPRLVASGGMGEVYRATDTVLERPVAVKVLAERYSRDPEARGRFKREAMAAARLSGEPHVITVFDVAEHAGRPFIVMEYLEGGSLHDKLSAGSVDPREALDWLGQAAGALDTAHRLGIVHRDVKPANLLLDREGSLQVVDFGIASASGLDTLTLPGTILGTAGYLSPEQARGQPATPASDRYALGVVAFELLTGRRPYASETPLTEAFAHASAPIPSAAAIAPGLGSGTDDALAGAMAKEPADRPASCVDLVEGLRRGLDADRATRSVLATADASRARRYRPRPRWRSRAAAAAVVLVAAGVTLAGYLLRDDSPSRDTATQAASEPSRATRTPQPAAAPAPTPKRTVQSGGTSGPALNDAGFAAMRARDYDRALPLLERAVAGLRGSGSLTEAYASYNLAFTRRALGRCDGVIELLARSERVQGARREIDRLRRETGRSCGDAKRDNGERGSSGRGSEGEDADR